MLASLTRRKAGLAVVLACATALAPAVAQAKPKAHAADAAGSVSSTPEISSVAVAAGRAKFGADATKAQMLAAYWTPDRMSAAKPIDSSPALAAAYQKFQGVDAARM